MATRQYIGARYVPKFYTNSVDGSAQWEANVVYDPLIFVTLTNGHMYISKKQVPATVGTPASNVEYWLDMGSYNGFIQHLQDEIDDINSDIQNLTFDRSRKFAIITDSYGIKIEGTNVPFTEWFRQYMGLTEGVNYTSSYLAGAGFIANTVHFTDVIDRLVANMPSGMSADGITDLIIAGGLNDHSITTGLDAAIESTIAYAKSKLPNAKIYIAVVGNAFDISTRQDMINNVVNHYLNCAKYGAYPLQNVQYVMLNRTYFQSDGTHPNNDGNKAIGEALACAVNKGYTKQYSSLTDFVVSGDSDSGLTTTAQRAHVMIDNNTIRLTTTNIQASYASAKTVQQGSALIGTFTSNTIIGNQYVWTTARVMCNGGTDDGVEFTLPVFLVNGSIYIVLPRNVNVTGFTIYRFNIMYNTLDC